MYTVVGKNVLGKLNDLEVQISKLFFVTFEQRKKIKFKSPAPKSKKILNFVFHLTLPFTLIFLIKFLFKKLDSMQ